MDEVGHVAQALRDDLGPDAILYLNECGCDHGPIPSALTFYSLDIYGTGASEVSSVRTCYEQSASHLQFQGRGFDSQHVSCLTGSTRTH